MAATRAASRDDRGPHVSEATKLAAAIRAAIVAGEVVPNQRLVEADLAAEYGVPRAAVRVALQELSIEGLVERHHYRGARVRSVTVAEAIEIAELRMVIEALCAARAAENAAPADAEALRELGRDMQAAVSTGDLATYGSLNRRLHSRLIELANHQTGATVLGRLRAQNVRHEQRLAFVPGRADMSLPEHLAIIEAVASKDPAAAELAMRRHLASVVHALQAQQRNPRGGSGSL